MTSWRTVVPVLVAALATPAAALAALFAGIAWSGCFIGCRAGGGDHPTGALLWLLALALLAAGPGLGWLLHRGRGVAAGLGGTALGAAGLVLLLGLG